MSLAAYKFSKDLDADFAKVLKSRVRAYFQEKNISKHANFNMVLKTIFMLALYFTPYFLMLFGVVEGNLLHLLMWAIMAFGMSGIGLSIMHDANHGSYSKNKTVNNTLSYLLAILGGNVENWRIQHNQLHHTYTNIQGHDDDLDSASFLRFSPHQPYMKLHKFQIFYAWFFYSLLTISWALWKEFSQTNRFEDMGLLENKKYRRKVWRELIIWKIVYWAYILVVPLVFFEVSWWITLIGFMVMHLIAGFVLSIVFQSAHVVTEAEFPEPPVETGQIENNWYVHQLLNTANFAMKNPLITWYVGGLNYQVEHHLFPDVCHIHYPKISKIVKATAEEYGIPYLSKKTFTGAILDHAKMLKRLGKSA